MGCSVPGHRGGRCAAERAVHVQAGVTSGTRKNPVATARHASPGARADGPSTRSRQPSNRHDGCRTQHGLAASLARLGRASEKLASRRTCTTEGPVARRLSPGRRTASTERDLAPHQHVQPRCTDLATATSTAFGTRSPSSDARQTRCPTAARYPAHRGTVSMACHQDHTVRSRMAGAN